ncbi:MAG: PAS domain-containing protein [Proteobacteria bacterium]|nr:PAS domain-containing protein [Pseudomonadota bacterium]
MTRPQQAAVAPVSESYQVVVYGTGPVIEAANAALAGTALSVAPATEPRVLAELVSSRASVVLIEEPQLASVRRPLRGRSGDDLAAWLVLVSGSALASRGALGRAPLEEVLQWPSEATTLVGRLRALGDALLAHRRVAALEQRMALLAGLAAAARSAEGYEAAIHRLLAQLAACTGARCARVLVPEPEKGLCHVRGNSDDRAGDAKPVRLAALAECRAAVETGQEVLTGPIDLGPRLALAGGQLKLAEMGQVLVVPLRHGDAVLGAVELQFVGLAAVAESTRELAGLAAALIAPWLAHDAALRAVPERTRARHDVGDAAALAQTLQQQRELVDRLADGVALLDHDGRIVHLNPVAEAMLGCASSALAERPFVELVEPEDRPALLRGCDELRAGRSPAPVDLRFCASSQPSLVVSVCVAWAAPASQLLLLTFRDATAARALSEELGQIKRFLEQLIDASPEAIVASDGAGAVALFNKAAEALFGLSAQQVMGRLPFDLLFPEGVGAKLREQLDTSRERGVGVEPLRSEIIDAQQQRVPVQLSVNVMPRETGALSLVAVISDLRERLRIEHDLVHVRERLLVSEKQALLAELAGTTAHELNQPLTSVMGYAELLLRRLPAHDVNHHAAETILEQAQRMADIVRKIGRITRYETKPYVGDTQILDLDRSTE